MRPPNRNEFDTPDLMGGHKSYSKKRRHGLALCQKTKIAQKLLKDLDEKIGLFHTFVISLRKQNNFELSQIGNMDETPMTFDLPASRTIDNKESTQSRLEPLAMRRLISQLCYLV